jgi:AMP-activated protein kinase-like protein
MNAAILRPYSTATRRPMGTAAAVVVVMATLTAGVPCWYAGSGSDLAAQTNLTLEFGGSQVGPPVGVEGSIARFLMGGVRASHYGSSGSGVFASVLFGQTLDESVGGSFLSGILEASLADRWTQSTIGSLDVRVLGYGTQRPFPYRAFAAEGGPSLRVRTERFGLRVRGIGGLGLSQLELWRVEGGRSRVFENDLWRYGGTTEIELGPVTSNFGVTGGWHRTPAGDYLNAGARFVFAGRWGLAEIRIDRWDTPTSIETTGGLALIVPIGDAWSLRGFFGRTDPDPLTLAQPGSGGGGMLIGRSMLTDRTPPAPTLSPWEIVEYGDAASRVRLRIVPPEAADAVQVMGDFTLWEPLAMNKEGDAWVLDIQVPVGTHHFGFLVDDEWYVPSDTPDVVPDEWGRLSATLVIEGALK